MSAAAGLVLAAVVVAGSVRAETADAVSPAAVEVTLDDFLRAVPEKDLGFHRILVDELKLKYRRALDVPAADWVASVLADYRFDPRERLAEEDSEVGLGLQWLLPKTGTTLSAGLSDGQSGLTGGYSRWEAGLTQDIARNAFGRAVRMEDRIVEMEIEIARHQIVEAYEDYLARLVAVYLDWYFAHENLKAARQGHRESAGLLENVEERRRRSVALAVDVDKVRLQVMTKEERVVRLAAEYEVQSNLARRAMGLESSEAVVPRDPTGRWTMPGEAEAALAGFRDDSRTARVLRRAEDLGLQTVLRYADDLLPSLELGVSYRATDRDGADGEYRVVSAVELALPVRRSRERARHETARAELRKAELSTADVLSRAGVDLRNLAVRIAAEEKRIRMTEERIAVSERILGEEKENYSLGRTSLNDLIRFVDDLEEQRFSRIARSVERTRYLVEWLRLSDRLVSAKSVLRTGE